MTKNLKTLAITFSVVLNLTFIGSSLYHQSGLFPLWGMQVEHERPLYEELNLSREQLEKFGPVRNRFHTFVNEQGRKIKEGRVELIELLAKEHPDRQAIHAKQEEIQALQREMQGRVIDHLLGESRLFRPEQREKFFALIQRRIEKSSDPRPRWMPQKQESPSKGKRP